MYFVKSGSIEIGNADMSKIFVVMKAGLFFGEWIERVLK
jgi:hypothetical protein